MRTLLRPLRNLARGKLARTLTVLGVGVLVVGWMTFAPTALGGSSTYVTTYGNSMEPLLHRGDLALVQAKPAYRVGDVVAYRSELLGTVVLHRIIGRDGDRYIFKGDHNTWTDADRPTGDRLLGEMVVHLPGIGARVQHLASPPAIAGLASVGFVPLIRRDRRRRSRPEAPTRGARLARPPRQRAAWGPMEPRMLAMTAVGLAVLGVSFSRPTTTVVARDLPFDERASFTYTGDAPNGSGAYQSGHVSAGQPVFLNLVNQLEVRVDYQASSTTQLDASGDIALTATVSDLSGWSHPLDVAGSTRFDGDRGSVHGTLDVASMRAVIANVQMATGIVRDRYLVNIEAAVTRSIAHAGARTQGVFTSKLEFNLDQHEMYLADTGATSLTSNGGGLLSVASTRPSSLTLLGRNIPVPAARIAALSIAALVIGLWLEWLVRSLRGDATSLIDRRYRSQLLPVCSADPAPGPLVQVERMADLARMADQIGAPILRRPDGSYDVLDGMTTYRYATNAAAA